MLKRSLFTIGLSMLSSCIFAQNILNLEVGAGISISQMVNSHKFQKGISYEVNPIIDKNIFISFQYYFKHKWGVSLNSGLITTGYESRSTQGFTQSNSFPIHFINKHKYDYFKIGLGLNYKIKPSIELLLNVQYLHFQKDYSNYGYFVRREVVIDNMSWNTPLIYEYESTDFEDENIAFEIGFSHQIWKGWFLKCTYLRSLFPAHKGLSGINLYDQAFTISTGYIFMLKK